ncbi:YfcC family protein [Anaerosacchariphilus polymeriproducens]|uniref:YfcC family protein n=1 Tax=Anaerosacchariphilus polymeriproducens TaxID=1812858 RepID=A0A371AWU9_9FIRM|nr:TRAP transporter large permease subunit [Anaerosacchariphilus polymeriproducens]RDU24047.1 YfcC family protein [Anaerosacchariphilus polymeriproducens]
MEQKAKKFSLPHVYTLAFILIILFAVMTWIIPSGQFERETIETPAGERDVAIAGSYSTVEKIDDEGVDLRQGIMEVLMAPTKGVQAAADVVAFILLLGGTFQILAKTNAMNAGIKKLIVRLKGKETLIIPLLMLLLGLGGSTYGMSEEVLPFYIMLMPIMFTMGYDSMTTFLVCFLAPQMGYAASTTNPFNVLIAQGVAGIQGNPQLGFRFIQWIVMMGLTIGFVCWYAARVKKNPKKSITYLDDLKKRETFKEEEGANDEFSIRQKLVLGVFALGMGIIVYGLLKYGWYMDEISMVFLGMGIVMGIVGGLREKEIAEEFVLGVKDIAFAAVIVGVCRGILVIAENGMIIDTILNNLSNALGNVGSFAFTSIMYVVQSLITILVPSSSGLASLTIPVMSPLCDLQGLNPEASVTVLQYANQLTNMISPTAGMTVAGLAVCKISFGQWWKTIWKFFLVVTVVALVFCAISAQL